MPTGTASAEGIDAIVRLIRDPSGSDVPPWVHETVWKLRNLIMQAVELSAHNRPMVVSQSTVSQEGNETPRHSLEAQALAAMASIARSPDSPGIEDVDADWARLFLERFSPRAFAFSIPGDKTSPTSADPHAQKREVMRIVEAFGAQPYEAVERYGVPRALHSATIVPY